MPFAVPMVWREQKDHHSDCYFCLTKISGVSFKQRKSIEYPNLPSAMRPVPHGDNLPVPKPPADWALESGDDDDNERAVAENMDTGDDNDPDFQPPESSPHLITQRELNDLVRLKFIKAPIRITWVKASRMEFVGTRYKNICVS
jgi:hypothetical protein